MKYYTLLAKDVTGRWVAEFGAYDKEDVKAELQDQRDHGVARSRLAIITTEDNDAAVRMQLEQRNMDEGISALEREGWRYRGLDASGHRALMSKEDSLSFARVDREGRISYF